MNLAYSSTLNINGFSVTIDVQVSAEDLRCLLGDGIFSRGDQEFQNLFQHSVLPAIFPLLRKTSETLSGALIIESCKRIQEELAQTKPASTADSGESA